MRRWHEPRWEKRSEKLRLWRHSSGNLVVDSVRGVRQKETPEDQDLASAAITELSLLKCERVW